MRGFFVCIGDSAAEVFFQGLSEKHGQNDQADQDRQIQQLPETGPVQHRHSSLLQRVRFLFLFFIITNQEDGLLNLPIF